jgi:hypothetical protein
MSNIHPLNFDHPEQIRMKLAEENWDEVESAVVILFNEGGEIVISHNTMPNERLLWAGHALCDYAKYGDS